MSAAPGPLLGASGICLTISSYGVDIEEAIKALLWAASELIEEPKKGVRELYKQSSRSTEKGVQS
jgi:hypothetical protein